MKAQPMSVHNTADAAHQAASAATYTGGTMAVGSVGLKYFGLTTSEWTLMFAGIGALMAVAGFAVNWFYKHQEYKLKLARAAALGEMGAEE